MKDNKKSQKLEQMIKKRNKIKIKIIIAITAKKMKIIKLSEEKKHKKHYQKNK